MKRNSFRSRSTSARDKKLTEAERKLVAEAGSGMFLRNKQKATNGHAERGEPETRTERAKKASRRGAVIA